MDRLLLPLARRNIRAEMHKASPDRAGSEPLPDLVDGNIHTQLLLAPLLAVKEIQLVRVAVTVEGGDSDADAADRLFPVIILQEKLHGVPGDLVRDVGRDGDLLLPGEAHEVLVPDIDLDDVAGKGVFPEPRGHGLRKHVKSHLHLLVADEIPGHCHAIPDALDRGGGVFFRDRRFVLTVRENREHNAGLSELFFQELRIRRRDIPDRENAPAGEFSLCRPADVEQILRRFFPDDGLIVAPVDDRHRVRLFIIRPELGKDLIPAYADADGDAEFIFDFAVELVGNFLAGAADADAVGHVEPAFIQPEAFDFVRVVGIDLPHVPGKPQVLVIIRRNDHDPRAGFTRLPQGRAGLDALPFCYVIGC